MSEEFNFRYKISGGGIDEERKVVLNEGSAFSVGRQGEGLRLSDPSISRDHFNFALERGKLFAIDRGSTNGTFVQGQQMSKQELVPGYVVQFGVYSIVILDTPASLQSPEKPKTQTKPKPEVNASIKKTLPLTEDLDLSFKGIVAFHRLAATNPQRFFEKTHFAGDVRRSIKTIACCVLLSSGLEVFRISVAALGANTSPGIFLQLLLGTLLLIALTTLFSVGQIVSLSYVLEILREFIGSEGRFEQYLRFSVYVAILGLTGQIISTMTFGIATPLVAVAILAWSVYGLLKVFEPKPLQFIGTLLVFGIVWMLVQRGLLGLVNPLLFLPPRI